MEQKYRVVVVGCGGMANSWVEYAKKRPDTEIVALVDIKEEFAQAMADRQELSCPLFTDVEQAVQATNANLVFDVTIPASHYAVSSAAMKLGCDVFGEKPLAETMEQCNQLVALADSTGSRHAIMQNRRYDPGIRALRELIEAGSIGKPGYIGADFFLAPHFGGFRDAMDSPLLLDMAIHTFDQARLIVGADPVSVYCQEFNPAGSWYAGNAAAICIFEMSDGSVFCYRGSWCAEGAPTTWEASWRITGEKGTAIWDGASAPHAEVIAPGDQTGKFMNSYEAISTELKTYPNTFHHGCLDEMFLSLEEGRPAETNSRDNRLSMAMVLASLESAKQGRKISIADFIGAE
ncbi:Gfo/Idh/MocA family protein [Paenibacillus radicis (ex Gao et al. 2016)]|uniref:Oxidoreductase n=1 Tax=Paenibacillus radicis (ex Gao et al. 2016) TaxID=1737354 RepID=A0A917GRB9_9BACL|nr:Gfo/Idh/MocA family oxidoreductase [Paenibacillus radicis (ex Gao et al. 2016)]GGG55064.1 oxidoreductase [Paenibacillus radicis (ex Gao et al. 2016)]